MIYTKSDPASILPSEITPESVYMNRRQFLMAGFVASAGVSMPAYSVVTGQPLDSALNETYQRADDVENITDYDDATSYNNFYELGTHKTDPKRNRGLLKTEPWTVELAGAVNKPQILDLDTVMKRVALEERIYRFRCVEAWSMVVPWIGFQLSELLKLAEPTSAAKFVRFESIYDPERLPMQRASILNWPYVEGLRVDEAMHPLAFMAVGMYGKTLPHQNGAPIRVVVPWKYGFKSAKSIVKISFVEKMPISSWMQAAAHEYGFYANVNPDVPHPRWSQAKERPLGSFFKKETQLFNGYGEFVADMYTGMDLTRFF